ncbi:Bug family tripartite tricarboxylate transporter substrate binding protein [Cupriavidus basilensis]|uniref:Bug family tripartite tricarboxylate transporter substrate binding protein n=1 Tax=Cupriavidus basilensis TaxID=68895 RepID=UPI0039F67398
MKRICTFGIAACALAAAMLALPAGAQEYPARPITLVVPHPAGGTSDILARTVAAEIGKTLGQTVLVDNRGGANGTIAAKQVAQAAPDGYTLLLATASTHGINPTLYRKISYDAAKDFAPVALLATVPNVLVVGKRVPVRNLPELTRYIKSKAGGANMGSAGAGTPGHLAGEMYKDEAALSFLHVPYKGGAPAITDLVGGQIDFMFTTVPAVLPHIKAGAVRALAVTSPARSAALPAVPTMAESGLPGFQAVSWHGVVAPAGTPPPVLDKLSKAIAATLVVPEVRKRLAQEGAEAGTLTRADFGKFIIAQIGTWGSAVRSSGASVD